MRKIVFIAVLTVLGFTTNAFANEADQKVCENPPSNGLWHGLAADGSKCACKEGYFNNRRIPKQWKRNMELLAGKGEINAVITDVCTKIEDVAAASRKHKIPVVEVKGDKAPPAPPTPLPTCSAAQEIVMAKGDEAVNDITCTGAGVKDINRITASCDNCRAPRADSVITPKTGGLYTQQVRVGSVTDAKKSHVYVTFLTKKDQQVPTVDFWVEWVPKTPPAPPAPVMSAAQIACEKRKYPGIWSNETKQCSCPGTDLVEQNGVCVPKPVPPPPVVKIVEDSGSYAHPFVALMGGYAGKSGGSFFGGAGLSIDIFWLEWSALVALGVPGATRLDANGNPVVLGNGKTDKRLPSMLARSGLRGSLSSGLGASLGGFYQMEGLNGGLNTPVQTAAGAYLGPDVRVQLNGLSVTLFMNATFASFQRGSEPSRFDPGFMAGMIVDVFNHRRR